MRNNLQNAFRGPKKHENVNHVYHAANTHADQTVATNRAAIERRSGDERKVDSAALVADLSDDEDADGVVADVVSLPLPLLLFAAIETVGAERFGLV